MSVSTSTAQRVFAASVAAAALLALAACSAPSDPSTSTSAANLDAAAGIVVGGGEIDIQLWSDPSCPHCFVLDQQISADLADAVGAGTATVTIHPMTYVSAKRNDLTDYSTRAAALLFAATQSGPSDAVLPLYSLIQEHQVSQEGAPTDADLQAYAKQAGVSADLSGAIAEFAAVATASNDAWLGTEIPGTTQVVDHVPLLVIDGEVFDIREDGTDAARFAAAIGGETAE